VVGTTVAKPVAGTDGALINGGGGGGGHGVMVPVPYRTMYLLDLLVVVGMYGAR
jgi:hypothetical protein